MILIDPAATYPRAALPKRELSCFLLNACEQIRLGGEVTVLLSTDDRLRELNRTYRKKNKATDVLSFPPAPEEFTGEPQTGGDLAISLDSARRQAEALGHLLAVEVKILMLHGLLHLAGLDHEQDTGQMARRETRLRRSFGLPAGLIQRSEKAVKAEASAKPTAAGLTFGPAAGPTSRKRAAGRPIGSSGTGANATGSSRTVSRRADASVKASPPRPRKRSAGPPERTP